MINESFKPQRSVTAIGRSSALEAANENLSAIRTLVLGVALVVSIAFPRAAAAQMAMDHSLAMGVPDLCAMPTVSAVATGLWSAPDTWSTGAVPGADARVAIPSGLRVTYDLVSDTVLNCVGVHGALAYRTTASSRLVVGTLFVYSDGALEIGTAAAPVAASALAELVIADQSLDLVADPEQFGTGLIAFGRVAMHGVPKAATFVRLSSEVASGSTQLALASAVADWAVGDQLVVPDTRHLRLGETKLQYVPQWEERTLSAVAGTTLTVSSGFTYLHEGARNQDGVLELLPHVANLSRNVLIRSANPDGTRGHVIAIGRADVDIRYARFLDLGRTTTDPLDSTTLVSGVPTHVGTNQIGRYALHMHHLSGPRTPQASGAQFTLIGNAIEAARKWGIVVHHSNYGLVTNNIVYNVRGAGVMFEDGSESFNTLDSNFVMRVAGVGGRGDERGKEFGFEGVGYWFRGPNNYVRKNVAANITASADGTYGYKFYQVYVDILVPKFQGADVSSTTDMQTADVYALPIREFSDNEVYGATESGLTLWWIGTYGTNGQNPSVGTSEIARFHAWHLHSNAFYNYPTHRISLTDFVVRGKDPLLTGAMSMGFEAADYMASDLVIDRADIQGMRIGISLSTQSGGTMQTVRNSILRNHTNVTLGTLWTSAYRADGIPARRISFVNVRMGAWDTAWSGSPVGDYVLVYTAVPTRTLIQVDDIEVFDHNGVAGDSFRLFYTQQAPEFVVPQSLLNTDGSPRLAGAPVTGSTNTQTWSQFGIAIAGAVAPCASTRARVVGAFACGGSGMTTPPPPPPISSPPPPPPPPPPPSGGPSASGLNQYREDTGEVIPPNGTIPPNVGVYFAGSLQDGNGDRVRLEVELRPQQDGLRGVATSDTISPFVTTSAIGTTSARFGLMDPPYIWQGRASDDREPTMSSIWEQSPGFTFTIEPRDVTAWISPGFDAPAPAVGSQEWLQGNPTATQWAYAMKSDIEAMSGKPAHVFNWMDQSHETGEGWAEAAGEQLAGWIASADPEKQRRNVLIGHNNGSVVVSEAARRLRAWGYTVDYVAYLDALDGPQQQQVNPLVHAWSGVRRTDNYWGTGATSFGPVLKGHAVSGAINLALHLDNIGVRDYYAGTILNPRGFHNGWFWTPNGGGFDIQQQGESAVDPLESNGTVATVFNGDFDLSAQWSYADAAPTFAGYAWATCVAGSVHDCPENSWDRRSGHDGVQIKEKPDRPGDFAAFFPAAAVPEPIPILEHAAVYVPVGTNWLTFDLKVDNARSDDIVTITMTDVDGAALSTVRLEQIDAPGWISKSIDVSPFAGHAVRIAFSSDRPGASTPQFWIDNIRLEQMPSVGP